jgi:hypothetical protein
MMTSGRNNWSKTNCRTGESGQAILFLLLALGIALLGAVAFSVDFGNTWFHRQSAQSAADAACTAGVMDLLVDSQGGATGHQGFTNGTAFNCAPGSTASPCKYARFNGYNSDGTGNLVEVKFPTSSVVPGLPSSSIASATVVPNAFIQVNVIDNVPTYFSGLLSGRRSLPVRASAVCGVVYATSPIPILVLDPHSPNSSPAQSAFNIQGSGLIKIVGGPTKSIQVNSGDTAASCGQSNCSVNYPWGSARVDLSTGGPNQTGSDFALYGAPAAAPTGFIPGTTGHWVAPSAPINDPFAQMCAPGQTGCPSINGNSPPAVPPVPAVPADESSIVRFPGSPCTSIPCNVAWKDHGCPDPAATRANGNCVLYTPGLYTADIKVKGNTVALFDPGLYYINAGAGFGLSLASNSTIRPGTGVGDGTSGVIFYFKGSSTVTVDSNSGKKTGYDRFSTLLGPIDSGGAQYPDDATHKNTTYRTGVKCTGTSTIPTNLPATIPLNPATDGANVLLGACTGYYGDPLGASDPNGIQRNFVFFQDRSATAVKPTWGGGGQFLLAGTMYFHSCNAAGTGIGCGATPTYFSDIFKMEGNSGSGTYVLGDIVVDNLTLGGTSGITMDLNPAQSSGILKAALLR